MKANLAKIEQKTMKPAVNTTDTSERKVQDVEKPKLEVTLKVNKDAKAIPVSQLIVKTANNTTTTSFPSVVEHPKQDAIRAEAHPDSSVKQMDKQMSDNDSVMNILEAFAKKPVKNSELNIIVNAQKDKAPIKK